MLTSAKGENVTSEYWPISMIDLRKCRACEGTFDESYFSMVIHRQGHAMAELSNPTCNTCIVKNSDSLQIISFFAEDAKWQADGACGKPGVDPELFFPKSREKLKEARWGSVCDSCPVLAQCAEFGAKTGSVGVWGGKYLGEFQGVGENGPGARLLLAGKCKLGHAIDSLDDIVLKKSKKGSSGYAGACKKCTLQRTAAWKRKQGGEFYAKEWARQKAMTPEQKAEAKRKQDKQSRSATIRKTKIQNRSAGVEPLTAIESILRKGCCCNGHVLQSEQDLYVTDNANARGGRSARCAQCQRERTRRSRKVAKG